MVKDCETSLNMFI